MPPRPAPSPLVQARSPRGWAPFLTRKRLSPPIASGDAVTRSGRRTIAPQVATELFRRTDQPKAGCELREKKVHPRPPAAGERFPGQPARAAAAGPRRRLCAVGKDAKRNLQFGCPPAAFQGPFRSLPRRPLPFTAPNSLVHQHTGPRARPGKGAAPDRPPPGHRGGPPSSGKGRQEAPPQGGRESLRMDRRLIAPLQADPLRDPPGTAAPRGEASPQPAALGCALRSSPSRLLSPLPASKWF